MATLYKRSKGAGRSPNWYLSYYVNGKQVRESTGTSSYQEAQQKLAERINNKTAAPKTRIDGLLDHLIIHYEVTNKDVAWCRRVVNKHLRDYFGDMKVSALDRNILWDWIELRKERGDQNATINRSLALLRRAYSLWGLTFPALCNLPESNTRRGFLERSGFDRIYSELPDHVKPIALFAYLTGCRKGEILKLKWAQVDLKKFQVRLHPGETKNKSGRLIPLSTELLEVLSRLPQDTVFVFTRNGKPIKSIRTAWTRACKRVGLENTLFHDMRRSAIRNMTRGGISDAVAMAISGHKTRSVFDRYNIVSDKDIEEARLKLDRASNAS